MIKGAEEVIESEYPLIVVVENDIGKVLGNALNVKLHHEKPVICIDRIHTSSGDYLTSESLLSEDRCFRLSTKRWCLIHRKR